MKPILKVIDQEGSYSKVESVSTILREHIKFEEYGNNGEYSTVRTNVSAGIVMRLSDEAMQHLVDSLSIELTQRDGQDARFLRNFALRGLADNWSFVSTRFPVSVSMSVGYQGIGKSNHAARMAKYEQCVSQVSVDWKEAQDELIELQLAKMSKMVSQLVEDCNDEWAKYLNTLLLEVNIDDAFIEAQEDAASRAMAEELDQAKAAMDRAKERVQALRLERKEWKRDVVLAHIQADEDWSEGSKAQAAEVREEARGKGSDRRLRMGY